MRCNACGERISSRNEFCPHCGEKVVREEVMVVPRRRIQVFKIIMIVLLIMVLVANIGALVLNNKVDLNSLDELFEKKEWLIINIFTFFAPTIIIYLFMVVGWVVLFAVDILGVLLSLLTMIRASRNKKIILLIIILAFVVLAIINYATRQV